jgi:hypothetical protein
MHIPGHIAVALAQHCLPAFSRDKKTLKPLLLASLFPDVVDKAIGYVLHMMPNGRHYAHNIFSLVGLSLAVSLVWGKTIGYAWFMGYLGHLLADSGDGLVPWYFPVREYNFKQGRFSFAPVQFIRESIFLSLVLIVYRINR